MIFKTSSSTILDEVKTACTTDKQEALKGVQAIDLQELNGATSELTLTVADSLEPNEVIHKMKEHQLPVLLQKNKKKFVEDFYATAEIVKNPQRYFDLHGANFVFGGCDFLEVSYHSPIDKSELKRQVEDFLQSVQENVRESVEAVIEEMYMNSMIDAPREASKMGCKVQGYSPGVFSTMRFFLEADRITISCSDPFGSLNLEKFVSRMNEVYERGAGESINFNEKAGGAGLGCIIMFEHCEKLLLGVKKGERTLVTCVIPVGLSNRQRAAVKKTLQLIKL